MKYFKNLEPFESLILWMDGQHDDTDALNAYINGEIVFDKNNKKVGDTIKGKTFKLTDTLDFDPWFQSNKRVLENCRFNFYPTRTLPYMMGVYPNGRVGNVIEMIDCTFENMSTVEIMAGIYYA